MQGHIDPPLDALGEQQVAAMAAMIGTPDAVVSSPLLRARQTAEAFGVPYEIDPRWAELRYGELDGARMADIDPQVWATWRADPTFRPAAGAETLVELDVRVADACAALCLAYPGTARVVVTTHVSPIKSALVWALGDSARLHWRFRVDQATLTRIEVGPDGPIVASFNETAPIFNETAPAFD